MLTTIIYRSHICDNVSFKSIEAMVARANERNGQADVTGILLFNGTHFFQLIEGPEEKVRDIYQTIVLDPRHYNLVELFCDYAPSRRFGKVGMELFDLREHDREEVLQTVMDRGTKNISSPMTTGRCNFSVLLSNPRKKRTILRSLRRTVGFLFPIRTLFIRTPPLSIIRKAGLLPFSRSSILSPAKLSRGKRCCVHRTASLLAPILPGWQGMIFISPTCTVSASRCLWRVN